MTGFIIRRLLWTIPVILLVILFTFVLMRQIEGNPFRTSERAIPESIQQNLEREVRARPALVRAVREASSRASSRSTSGRRSCSATGT